MVPNKDISIGDREAKGEAQCDQVRSLERGSKNPREIQAGLGAGKEHAKYSGRFHSLETELKYI